MKKKLLLVTAVFAVLTLINFKTNAQTVKTTGLIPVKITLGDIFAIDLLNNQEILFQYATVADYNNPQQVLVPDQFAIMSTKTYSVSVKAEAKFSTKVGNALPVPLSILQVSVSGTTLPTAAATFAAPTALSDTENTPLVIATAGKPALGTLYSIRYNIPSALPLLDKVAGDYTTNITYTVTNP